MKAGRHDNPDPQPIVRPSVRRPRIFHPLRRVRGWRSSPCSQQASGRGNGNAATAIMPMGSAGRGSVPISRQKVICSHDCQLAVGCVIVPPADVDQSCNVVLHSTWTQSIRSPTYTRATLTPRVPPSMLPGWLSSVRVRCAPVARDSSVRGVERIQFDSCRAQVAATSCRST